MPYEEIDSKCKLLTLHQPSPQFVPLITMVLSSPYNKTVLSEHDQQQVFLNNEFICKQGSFTANFRYMTINKAQA